MAVEGRKKSQKEIDGLEKLRNQSRSLPLVDERMNTGESPERGL